MAKRPRAASPVVQSPVRRTRRLVAVVGVLAAVGGAWGWRTSIYPRQLYRQAERALPQRPLQAASLAEEAVSLSGGTFPEAQLLWSRAFLRLGQPQEALGCFSVIANPSALDAAGLISLGDEARLAGEVLLATFALQAVPEGSDHYVDACHRLMEIRSQQGQPAEVLKLGEKVAARNPDSTPNLLLLAQAREQLGNFSAAVSDYQSYLRKPETADPEQVVLALRRLTNLAIQLGEFELAQTCLDDLRHRTPPTIEDQLSQARLLRMNGDIEPAWALVDELLTREPPNPAALELHATLAFDRGDDAVAESELRRVLRSQPFNKLAHYKLAQLLQRTGRGDEAEPYFQENRRLTECSLQILELQKESFADPLRESLRLRKLAELYSEIGRTRLAEQLQIQARAMEQAAGN